MKRTVKKPSERKEEIIQAATHLFQTKDYEHTSMQDIIEYLGIAKGTIYHYFRSKDELLEAVIMYIVDANLKLMQARVAEAKGDALQKFKILSDASNMAVTHATIWQGLHRPGNEAMHTRLLAVALIKQAPLYAQVIQQGCDEGIFKTTTPLEAAEFILAGAQFLIDYGIYPWSPQDIQRRIQALPLLLEQQLQAPTGSFNFLIKSYN